MKIIALTFVALAITTAVVAQPASAKEFGRGEKSGDMNLLQIEPSIINERFYTSGKAERQQYCGKVLPAGAPIPDNDAPLSEQQSAVKESQEKKSLKDAKSVKEVKEIPSAGTAKDVAAPKLNSENTAPAVVAPATKAP